MIAQKQFTAKGTINGRRIVKFDAAENEIIQASAASDRLLGVYLGPGNAATNDLVDCCLLGECLLDVAGAIGRGMLLTADSNGKGVQANPSAGVNNRVIAMALQSGTDITIKVLVLPSQLQGA